MRKKLLFIFSVLWMMIACLHVALLVLKHYYGLILIVENTYNYIQYATSLLSFILIILFVNKYVNKKWLNISLVVIGVITIYLIYFGNVFSSFLVGPTIRHYFISPNGVNKFLVEERRTITSCSISGYEVKYGLFKVRNTYVNLAEPDLPITNGKYQLKWINENSVIISIYTYSQEKRLSLTIHGE